MPNSTATARPAGVEALHASRRGRRWFAWALTAGLLLAGGAAGGAGYMIYQLIQEGDPFSGAAGARSADGAGEAPLPPPPPVPPVEYLPVTAADARSINAATPFTTEPVPPATPFVLAAAPADTARAIDCLAAAAWYEAGDDAVGAGAVVQVVLNRLRHRAFPKTVCGVVFQGSERATGCQFTFTCDGALRRRTPSAAAWGRARQTAAAGLNGFVFRPVGYATHYHTDWVVPNWSRSVDKVAAVDTHLFFRWRGANGRSGAFRHGVRGPEPVVVKLAALSSSHRPGAGDPPVAEAPSDSTFILGPVAEAPAAAAAAAPAVDPARLRGNQLAGGDAAANLFVVGVESGEQGGGLALVALDLCRPADAKPCTVVGFRGEPGRVLLDGSGRATWPDRAPDFYYYADRSRGREVAYWNCAVLRRPNPAQCMGPGFTAVR